jgi:predicted RNase H-like HicB family nuclease
MRKEIIIIQLDFASSGKWFDVTTFGNTLEEVREELQDVKKEFENDSRFRIIKRVTTVEDFVIE